MTFEKCPSGGMMYIVHGGRAQWDNWGDYASILIHGMAGRGGGDGLLQLERTGPYVPPVTNPSVSIVLTEAAKASVQSRLPELDFRPVILAKCVRLDWHSWDPTLEHPPKYPAGDEPENYIDGRRHNPKIAAEVGDLWELVPTIIPDVQGENMSFRLKLHKGEHIVRCTPLGGGCTFVSPRLRDALHEVAENYLTFGRARLVGGGLKGILWNAGLIHAL